MTDHPRIALIHATRLAIGPIEAAATRFWPEAETISILDEGLSVDRSKSVALSPELLHRIGDLAQYAEASKARGILFTCSAFGTAIEQAANAAKIPVMKPNEAMFDLAFTYGDRVAMIYTFPASAPGMETEFKEAASSRKSSARLTTIYCKDALDAKRRGDQSTHDRLIVESAANIKDADVILLAQFSMATAADQIRQKTTVPVLTSPESAIQEIRHRVEKVDIL